MSESRVVLISGGSRGLGKALVEHFLGRGDRVATFSRSRTPFIAETHARISDPNRFEFRELDATDFAALRKYADELYQHHGRLDVLVNNAGVAYDGTLATFPDGNIERLIHVNLTGALSLSKACLRYMLLQSHGRIISISSIIGQRGYAGLAVYSASKAGLEGMTRSLARELGPRHITVNAVAPGYLDTEMTHGLDDAQRVQIVRRTPLGRLGTAADVVPVVDFLASDAAEFITGQVITVDGGITC